VQIINSTFLTVLKHSLCKIKFHTFFVDLGVKYKRDIFLADFVRFTRLG